MYVRHLFLLSLLPTLTLAACSMAPDDHAEGGLTVGENERLERAAQRIDERTPSPARAESDRLEQQVRQRLADERGEQ